MRFTGEMGRDTQTNISKIYREFCLKRFLKDKICVWKKKHEKINTHRNRFRRLVSDFKCLVPISTYALYFSVILKIMQDLWGDI